MKKIETRELTVAEVRQVFDSMENRTDLHTVEILFPNELPVMAVSLSTGLSLEELDGDIPPSEIKQIIERVKEKNPFFLSGLQALAQAGAAFLETLKPR
jgi:hypothetical protein